MNWYKTSQQNDDRLVENFVYWLDQAEKGNSQPDLMFEDMETVMGQTVDPTYISNSLMNAVNFQQQKQGYPMSESQNQLIESIRSYVDGSYVQTGEMEMETPDIDMEPII